MTSDLFLVVRKKSAEGGGSRSSWRSSFVSDELTLWRTGGPAEGQ